MKGDEPQETRFCCQTVNGDPSEMREMAYLNKLGRDRMVIKKVLEGFERVPSINKKLSLFSELGNEKLVISKFGGEKVF